MIESENRTCGHADQWFDGNELSSADNGGGARKRRAPATTKMAGDCEQRLACPVQHRPSGSFRARALSAFRRARVTRVLRENGHTAIEGGRYTALASCFHQHHTASPDHRSVASPLASCPAPSVRSFAPFSGPPPSSLSIARSSVRARHVIVLHHPGITRSALRSLRCCIPRRR